MSNNGKMSDKLLATLNVLQGQDDTMKEVSQRAIGFLDDGKLFDKDTGEMIDAPPAYEPLQPAEVKVEDKDSKVPDIEQSDATEDYRRVRNTTYAVQEAALFMMTQVSKLAASTENPRVYSVFKELGELVRGCNKDLLDNQKSITQTKASVPPTDGDDETTVGIRETEDGTEVVVRKKKSNSANLLKTIEEARIKMEADEKARLLKKQQATIENETQEVVDAEFKEAEE